MRTPKRFWNDGYKQGFDYRLISDEEIKRILNVATIHVQNALDLGCGTGDAARKLAAEGVHVTAVDISDVAIKKAKAHSTKGIDYQEFDFENEDISQLGTFDLVLCKLILAFVEDKPAFIDSVARVLKPNGLLVIINPVITNNGSSMPPRLKKISVDDNLTMSLLKDQFELIGNQREKASNYHEIATYIAQRKLNN